MTGLVVIPPRGNGDCTIAAVVNALEAAYEDVAAAFGFPVIEEGGPHSVPEGRGYLAHEFEPAMKRLGRPARLIWPRLAKDALLDALAGRTAVLLTIDSDGEGHCLAMRSGILIDPRAENPLRAEIGTVFAVLIFE